MLSLENVDVVKTKDFGDVALAQLLMDSINASSTGHVTVLPDASGTGFIIHIPHGDMEGVH